WPVRPMKGADSTMRSIRVVLPDTRLPFYLLAHSTGGLIALSAAPYLTTRIDRMVLSAHFIGLTGQSASPRVIRALA
ncbi:hypothetical protein AB9E11_36505, partial [Rhizobium leguminosarum]